MHIRQVTLTLSAACAAALLAACGAPPQGGAPAPGSTDTMYGSAPSSARASAARPDALRQCTAILGSAKLPDTVLQSADVVPAGGLTLAGQPVPQHCLVKGHMHPRKGADGRDYAIGFEMRLPVTWNGRFYYQANGGLDGNVQPAQGALGGGPLTGALMQGFAVISSDAGHTGAQTPYFGSEPQARLDYGYQAVAKLTPMAKRLIAAAYGRGPDRSYIGGCSNGGRHAMVAAARVGDQYDGYLVGAPGYRLPRAALEQIWGAQQWSRIAIPGALTRHPMNPSINLPDLGSALLPNERRLLSNTIVARCDALDGINDGMVQATAACQAAFDVKRDIRTCTGLRDGTCLTDDQKSVITTVFAGGRTASGQPIYSGWVYDPGVAGANWAQWKFVNSLALDPLAIGTVFSVPPGRVDPLAENIDARLPLFSATNDTYRESGWSLMTPPGHDNPRNMAALQSRGAKMVLYHGVSDAVFSSEDTRAWMDRLDRALGGNAASFARYYPVPGMNHCSGGPATDQFDLLTPLVRWVEQGVAPQSVVASARGAGNAGGVNTELPASWTATRTRPLCPYPTVARYKGSGDPEKAENFNCR